MKKDFIQKKKIEVYMKMVLNKIIIKYKLLINIKIYILILPLIRIYFFFYNFSINNIINSKWASDFNNIKKSNENIDY